MAVAAIDYGRRRIGLAISDDRERTALPLGTIERHGSRRDIEEIQSRIRGRGVRRIVVGLPLNMNGTEGPAAREAQAFGRRLGEACRVSVEMFDERLTSVEAEDRLARAGAKGARRRRAVDAVAAMVILEGWIAAQRAGE
jgi:putative Holliday junction resolvase